MRIEEHHGRKIVCGHIFPITEVNVAEVWQSSSGSTVVITKVGNDIIYYAWREREMINTHNKDSFSFQCRYCKVVK